MNRSVKVTAQGLLLLGCAVVLIPCITLIGFLAPPFWELGSWLSIAAQMLALIEEIGHPNIRLQYDFYHQQRMEGNLIAFFTDHIGQIGHIQIADSPDRHEPGTGEIAYDYVFDKIDELGYDGWVALEYKPSTTTEASLGWLKRFGYDV